jgi:glyoxylase-like metal-dependent hydrolase (beta-lactamase superfamily II)
MIVNQSVILDKLMKRISAILALLAICLPALAHEYLSFDELTDSFGMDLDNTQIATETVAPGLHVLFGVGGNVIASIGHQGVLMVDSQFPQMIPRIRDTIKELGGEGIDFTINTHWHFDHADGNPLLGRDGSWLVSQSNSRRMMSGEHAIDLVSVIYKQPPYPAEALPVITFSDHMQFHFNGETIDLFHFGPAHTTGDAAVYFRSSNVVHMGDVFNASYPFIDAGNGGDLEGMIRFCRKVLAELEENSIVIPGHGPVLGYADLHNYTSMLETVGARISRMIDDGKSLEEVIAAAPTADFDEQYGNPDRFIDRAYVSLSR